MAQHVEPAFANSNNRHSSRRCGQPACRAGSPPWSRSPDRPGWALLADADDLERRLVAIRCSTFTDGSAAAMGAADADAIDMTAVAPASTARAAVMTANLRMAPPYLYRTCRLVLAGGSNVQQSAPSRHITLDSNRSIHAQSGSISRPLYPASLTHHTPPASRPGRSNPARPASSSSASPLRAPAPSFAPAALSVIRSQIPSTAPRRIPGVSWFTRPLA